MIRFLLTVVFIFALMFWLPMHESIGLDFLDYDVRIQLWLLILFEILIVAVLLFLYRIVRAVICFPRQIGRFNQKRSLHKANQCREKMVAHLLMKRDDCVLPLYKDLANQAQWFDHIVGAFSSLKSGNFLLFDQAIVAIKEAGFSEEVTSMLRISCLDFIERQQLELEVVPLLQKTKTSHFAWLWAYKNKESITALAWFYSRKDAKSCLSEKSYNALLAAVVNMALSQLSVKEVLHLLDSHEKKKSPVLAVIIQEMHRLGLREEAAAMLKRSLQRESAPELIVLGTLFLADEHWSAWFLSYSQDQEGLEFHRMATLVHWYRQEDKEAVSRLSRYLRVLNKPYSQLNEAVLPELSMVDVQLISMVSASTGDQAIYRLAEKELSSRQLTSQYFANG